MMCSRIYMIRSSQSCGELWCCNDIPAGARSVWNARTSPGKWRSAKPPRTPCPVNHHQSDQPLLPRDHRSSAWSAIEPRARFSRTENFHPPKTGTPSSCWSTGRDREQRRSRSALGYASRVGWVNSCSVIYRVNNAKSTPFEHGEGCRPETYSSLDKERLLTLPVLL